MMFSPAATKTNELGDLCLRLREDLRFAHRAVGGTTCFVIEDPLNLRFYRLGAAEYTLVSLLDGRTTLRQAVAITTAVLGREAFSELEGASICRWLLDSHLATHAESAGLEPNTAYEASAESSPTGPLCFRLPLGNPDALLTWLQPRLNWATGLPGLVIWMFLLAAALFQLSFHADGLWTDVRQVWSGGEWLWLAVIGVVLKFIHEMSHGLVCKRYGGDVRQCGLNVVLLFPMPYVDVTSAWRFPSKWMRIHVALAGMYVELFVAALAALVWVHTEAGFWHSISLQTMILASVATVAFNANPLMRFDGYYAFAEWHDIPNLYSHGTTYVGYLFRRYLLGMPASLPQWPARKARWIRVFGVASFGWRIVVSVGLLIAAAGMFQGAGVLLALLSLLLWFGVPAVSSLRRSFAAGGFRGVRWLYVSGVASLFAVTSVALWLWIPTPWVTQAPGIVVYEPLEIVRVRTAGWVSELRIAFGQPVATGQILAVLHNPELQAELAEAQLSHDDSAARCRNFREQDDILSLQQEEQKRRALAERLKQLQADVEGLLLRAPCEGTIISRNLAWQQGAFLEAGAELLAIGDEQHKQILVSVGQRQVDVFRQAVGDRVRLRAKGEFVASRSGRLHEVEPGASVSIRELALAAPGGGPLAVVRQPRRSTDEALAANQDDWQFLEPRFTAAVALSPTEAPALRAGQSTQVLLNRAEDTLGVYVWNTVNDWWRVRISEAFHTN